ncbi:hypothetical protein BB559_005495 [Furculomyces boomerangus]|uniref:ER membrane protein complex subunit 3 n=2 Tax=Harpellales TaxID=61421 RepID=A0A2T9Y8E0_9FUNG|nr:hypothetical protein BB559_005495 [Furculomyces boomerangus]PVZ98168.1 hypothetical protein BB558_005805 [Smittium angustum]
MLARATFLVQNSGNIPQTSFQQRAKGFSKALESGEYLEFPDKKEMGTPNPMADPKVLESMIDGIKSQMMGIIPQTLIMGWIQFFFSGFILTKLPFPLGNKFKSMLQAGINTPNMDVTWVSSLSFYFLNLFGLNGVFGLFLSDGGSSANMMNDLKSMGGIQQQAAGQPQDYHSLFIGLKENLDLVHYRHNLDQVETRVLQMYGRSVPVQV